MTGLLRKDFLLIVKNFSFTSFIVYVILLPSMLQNSSMVIPMLCIATSMILAFQVSLALGQDESAKWLKNVSAMPITVAQEVFSKYLLTYFIAIISIIISIVFVLISSIFLNTATESNIMFLFIAFALVVLYNSIVIPATYKLGTGKSRYILYLFVLIPTFSTLLLNSLDIKIDINLNSLNFNFTVFLLAVSVIVLSIISFTISLQIQKKKEFS